MESNKPMISNRLKTSLVALALLCVCSVHAAEYRKVLFLGNSITLHGPSQKVDWSGNWGMRAIADAIIRGIRSGQASEPTS